MLGIKGFCARYSLPKKAAAQVRRIVARGEETAGEKVYECILIERILNHEIEDARVLHAKRFRIQGSRMQKGFIGR
uniref:30S ribosomal protein S7 n=1 Tax=Loa loa TaxID=7209 RepID=A0A1I7V7H1_LOALO